MSPGRQVRPTVISVKDAKLSPDDELMAESDRLFYKAFDLNPKIARLIIAKRKINPITNPSGITQIDEQITELKRQRMELMKTGGAKSRQAKALMSPEKLRACQEAEIAAVERLAAKDPDFIPLLEKGRRLYEL